ncbi:MAG: DUF3047 domain-containing protein [Burkholderiales bacterium]
MKYIIALLIIVTASALADEVSIVAGAFSQQAPGDALPRPWRTVTIARIARHTDYALVSDSGVTVLRAKSDASMSSQARTLDIDSSRFPWLRWRWRVENLLAKSDMRTKDGDDFPVRLYVMFDYDIGKLSFFDRAKLRIARLLYGSDIPYAALCYVWANREPVGATAWNAFTDRVRMIVVESGAIRLGQWVDFERNVAKDFEAAFGDAAPRVSGIAIASDSDNTQDQSLAYYGDIVFSTAPIRSGR